MCINATLPAERSQIVGNPQEGGDGKSPTGCGLTRNKRDVPRKFLLILIPNEIMTCHLAPAVFAMFVRTQAETSSSCSVITQLTACALTFPFLLVTCYNVTCVQSRLGIFHRSRLIADLITNHERCLGEKHPERTERFNWLRRRQRHVTRFHVTSVTLLKQIHLSRRRRC